MIKEYKKKSDNKTYYMYTCYLGTDPITGKQVFATKRGFKTQREAIKAQRLAIANYQQHGKNTDSNLTLMDAYEGWYEQYRLTVRESSLNVVTSIVKKGILEKYGKMKLSKFTIRTAQKIVNDWYDKYATYRKYYCYMTQIFDYAVVSGAIKENPFKHVKLPKSKPDTINEEDLYYTKEELIEFLKLVEDDIMYYAIFRILAFTGIRKGELMALQYKDIDFKNKTLSVNKTVAYGMKQRVLIQEPKTKKSLRVISLDDNTIKAIKRWQLEQRKELFRFGHNSNNEDQFLFTNPVNNELLSKMTINHRLKSICEANKFKCIKLHGFRHTACSLMFEAGFNMQEIQNRLGHSSLEITTKVYAHFTKKQEENMAQKFANYVNF